MQALGVELTDEEFASLRGWFDQPEAKIFDKVLSKLIVGAKGNALKDSEEGQSNDIFLRQREQFIGEAKGFNKIAHLPNALTEG